MELHGEATDVQWSHLAEPANAGSSEIILDRGVDWQPGNQIVIAPTNFEALETEVRTIVRVLNETITLDSPLTYYHEGNYTSYRHNVDFMLGQRRSRIKITSIPCVCWIAVFFQASIFLIFI